MNFSIHHAWVNTFGYNTVYESATVMWLNLDPDFFYNNTDRKQKNDLRIHFMHLTLIYKI